MIAAERRSAILDLIARGARHAQRKPSDVALIAVSKTRSVSQIEELIAAGQRDFGESRVQEAQEKWPDLKSRFPDVRLHMIGRLQSNKADDAVALFEAIHSLDRTSLLDALVTAAAKAGRTPDCFVQVNIGAEQQKGGVPVADLSDFLDRVRATPLPLAGLMAIPPAGPQPGPYFALLAKLAAQHNLSGLSMGMSADVETAVMLGANHVRVGTALFED
ncbi:MAG: YggS family pyridoxal phosphate-dependent enzyme [Sphingomicrobium sp.]